MMQLGGPREGGNLHRVGMILSRYWVPVLDLWPKGSPLPQFILKNNEKKDLE